MALFSRNPPASDAAPVDEVPFESLRRSPRNPRKARTIAGDPDGTVLLDPTETTKARARRRLIGAIALALAAIVFVPMLFDRTPVVPTDDIALSIPDRNTPFEGRRGVPDPSRGPLKPSSDLPGPATAPIAAPLASAEPASKPDAAPTVAERTPVAETAERPVEKPAEKPAEKLVEKPSDKPAEKSATKSADAKPADKPKAAVAPSADDPRALAALEGRTPPSATPAPTAERSYAVQVAAFSAADKAKGLRDQLVAGGLRSYTESVSTAQGLRTRVRLGPFPSREAADRAKQKLKAMKLDGSVVPL